MWAPPRSFRFKLNLFCGIDFFSHIGSLAESGGQGEGSVKLELRSILRVLFEADKRLRWKEGRGGGCGTPSRLVLAAQVSISGLRRPVLDCLSRQSFCNHFCGRFGDWYR